MDCCHWIVIGLSWVVADGPVCVWILLCAQIWEEWGFSVDVPTKLKTAGADSSVTPECWECMLTT